MFSVGFICLSFMLYFFHLGFLWTDEQVYGSTGKTKQNSNLNVTKFQFLVKGIIIKIVIALLSQITALQVVLLVMVQVE